jgi:hypothetical protein
MDAVCDRVDDIMAKHGLADLSVLFRDAIDVMAEVQREVGHVQHTFG